MSQSAEKDNPNELAYLTLAQVAHRWHVHEKTAARWLRDGVDGRPPIPPITIGRRKLYLVSRLEAWERLAASTSKTGQKRKPKR